MENRSHALIAGLFSLLLGFSAIAALWWFGGDDESTNEYVVMTRRNVTGLSVQGQVRYRGIRVGRVEAIKLDPSDSRSTLIRISVHKDIPVTRGTTARLGFQGLTGIAHILLEDRGTDTTPLGIAGENLASGEAPRIPMQDSLMQEFVDLGGDTLRQAREFLISANQVMNAENRQNIGQMLANLEATTRNMTEATTQLRQVLTPENIRTLSSTLAHAERTVGQAAPFFEEARGLVANLQSVSQKLDATLGTSTDGGAATLMPKLNDLSTELAASAQRLNRVLQMLEESPQSLIFGRQKIPPGPGETGFVAPGNKGGKP
ncbi:MlaD family protein [Propionivibrio soli]|uniref:MlaD family protein n=1 Tax=Propionivibrio soli TaxID=2976531 RepID=UPI0021E8A3DB|nr:MlaD family protein [Propionivibrio soli]